ncbi:MAG TPA: hypothetical protein VLO07_09470, partial [Thermoanaerobaculia bacterium]|nr:hypothetical protein [Thermoanaerobaculia bacterium]
RLYAAKSVGRWAWTAQVGAVFPGPWKAPVILSTKPFGRAFISVARQLGAKRSLGASFTLEQSPFRGRYGDLTRAGGEVALGAEHNLGRRWKTRLTLTEHIPALGDRADVGLALKLVHR